MSKRKHLVWVLGLALAVGVTSLAFGAANFQKITGTFKASSGGLSKTKFKFGSINVITETGDADGDGKVNPAVRAQVFFDEDLVFFTKGVATCDLGDLTNTTTPEAKRACPGAQVGAGAGRIAPAGNAESPPIDAVVTAFNGKPKNGKPVILLHSRVEQPLANTAVLVGVLKYMPKSSPFGRVLDVDIPELAFGSAITRFQVRVNRQFRFKGKRRSYVRGRCSAGNLRYRGIFRFNGAPAKTANDKQDC